MNHSLSAAHSGLGQHDDSGFDDAAGIVEVLLLESVAAGLDSFDHEQRRWALVEGVELSRYNVTEVQLAEGGDARIAQRVLAFMREQSGMVGGRKLSPLPSTAPVAPSVDTSSSGDRKVLSDDELRMVVAGTRPLSHVEREAAIVDALIRSSGGLPSSDLEAATDAALASHLLTLPKADPLTGELVKPPKAGLGGAMPAAA